MRDRVFIYFSDFVQTKVSHTVSNVFLLWFHYQNNLNIPCVAIFSDPDNIVDEASDISIYTLNSFGIMRCMVV